MSDQPPPDICTWGQMKHAMNMQTGLDDAPVFIQIGDDGELVPYQGFTIKFDGPNHDDVSRVILFAGQDTSGWRKRYVVEPDDS